jgi:hypothetical protein
VLGLLIVNDSHIMPDDAAVESMVRTSSMLTVQTSSAITILLSVLPDVTGKGCGLFSIKELEDTPAGVAMSSYRARLVLQDRKGNAVITRKTKPPKR